jgi:hypothetical protein
VKAAMQATGETESNLARKTGLSRSLLRHSAQ